MCLLILVHLRRLSGILAPVLKEDIGSFLRAALELTEPYINFMKKEIGVTLSSAILAIQMRQAIVQAVPFDAMEGKRGSEDWFLPFFQLPYSDSFAKKILGRKSCSSFDDFYSMDASKRRILLLGYGCLSSVQIEEVEKVLRMMPSFTFEVDYFVKGGEVLFMVWVKIRRLNGQKSIEDAFCPFFPLAKDGEALLKEGFYFVVGDSVKDKLWCSKKFSVSDNASFYDTSYFALIKHDAAAVKSMLEHIDKKLSTGTFLLLAECALYGVGDPIFGVKDPELGVGDRLFGFGEHVLSCHIMSDSWIGIDSKINLNVPNISKSIW